MCGIAGVVGERNDSRVDRAMVHQMCQTMVHRGPDDEGIFVQNGVGLGMRRLSVIDLAGGHQPIFNEDRSIAVVLNGEIYNFLELRQQLESRGHRFSSQSDTEVIVHLYEEIGSDCVSKLRGMFGFALFDTRQRRLLLARDRLGKKPLHYALVDGQLWFGSEIKAILAVAPQLAEINQSGLLQYLYFGYIGDPLTAYAKIQKIPPGHLMEFQDGQLRLRQYWDFPEYGTYSPRSEGECLEELECRLAEAVKIRLISDVPLGAFLSGGTDSSTIVALMARASSKPVKTFSIGYRAAEFNEAPYARLVAEKFGTEHHELVAEPNIQETIESITSSLDEPFGDSSMLPTYFVSSLARKYVTVVLSGDGGDEAFAGYDRYRTQLRERAGYPVPVRAGRWYRENIFHHLPHWIPGRNFAYSISLPWPERYIEAVSLAPYERNFAILASDFVASFQNGDDPLNGFRRWIDKAPSEDPLARVLYLDSKTYLPGDILTKVDRMSMAASLEARAPMLDHVFIEWVTSLAPKWKFDGGRQKYILLKLARKLGVPSAVLDRPKQGFAVPLRHWLRHDLKDMVLSLLLDSQTLQRGYFNPRGAKELIDHFFQGRTDDCLEIWRLMMFELWFRNFHSKITGNHARPTTTCAPC
jgi:asparagine synthase (glutamine-hydrolysing)